MAGLADDWKFSIAYNAALQAATVALSAAGYRAGRDQHHYRTIQSLSLTISWAAAKVDRFDRLRKKRNIVGYETAGVISEREAREMYELAAGLRDDVLEWLKTHGAEEARVRGGAALGRNWGSTARRATRRCGS